MLIVIAKLCTTDAVGRFALAFAVTAPITMLFNLQLRSVQATDMNDRFSFGSCLVLRLAMTSLAFLTSLGIGWATLPRRNFAVLGLVALAKSAESISDVLYGKLQKHDDMRRIAISMAIKGVSSLLTMFVLLRMTGNLEYACLGLGCCWTAILFFYDIPAARKTGPTTLLAPAAADWKTVGKLARTAFPLGIVIALISLNSNAPRYVIERYLGTSEVGVYSVIASLMMVGSTVCGALGQAASTRLATSYRGSETRRFYSLTAKLVMIAGAIGLSAFVTALVGGRFILGILFRPEYARFSETLVVLMLAALVSYMSSMLGYALTAAHRFACQVPIFTVSTLSTIVACVLLIPRSGLVGAAAGVTLGTCVQAICMASVLYKDGIARLVNRTRACQSY